MPVSTSYHLINNELVSKKDNSGARTYFHNDHLGSTTVITNQAGSLVEQTKYDPWGEVNTGGTVSKFQYTGQEKDTETGLNYYNFRYYDPHIRRFTQPDDIVQDWYDPQTLNRYSYVKNNPIKYTDPSGHCIWDACLAEVALAATAYLTAVTTSPDLQVDTQFLAMDGSDFQSDPSVGKGIAVGVSALAIALPGASTGPGSKNFGRAVDKTMESWKFGESSLSKVVSGGKKGFDTPLGKRIVDVYNKASNTINEAKSGYTTLTKSVKTQINKDASIVKSGAVEKAAWHFFTSPVTGKGGPSAPLFTYLLEKGIEVFKDGKKITNAKK